MAEEERREGRGGEGRMVGRWREGGSCKGE